MSTYSTRAQARHRKLKHEGLPIPPELQKEIDDEKNAPPSLIREGEETVIDYSGGEVASFTTGLKLLAGLSFLCVAISYLVTGTPFWGSETKLVNPRYLRYWATERGFGTKPYRVFTESELAIYDGTPEHLELINNTPELKKHPYTILLAINGTVYDVSASPHTYGPGGSYSFFSGKDASRAFITGCFQQDLTYDLRGLEDYNYVPAKIVKRNILEDTTTVFVDDNKDGMAYAREVLLGWSRFFDEMSPKYWKVGTLIHQYNYSSDPNGEIWPLREKCGSRWTAAEKDSGHGQHGHGHHGDGGHPGMAGRGMMPPGFRDKYILQKREKPYFEPDQRKSDE